MTEGRKDDQNKNRVDLLPVDVLQETAKVLTDGAQRYGERNWENGMSWNRPYGALLRHLWAWWSGEEYDPCWLNILKSICCVLRSRAYHS